MKKATGVTLLILVTILVPLASLSIRQVPSVEAATTVPDLSLAEYWAPLWYQDIDSTDYDADYLTNFNFDGDWDGTNNWENQPSNPLKAYVYYWVVEVETHWFIGYSIFYPRHWGAPSHENDMAGCLLVVEKDGSTYGKLLLILTTGNPSPGSPRFPSYKRPSSTLPGADGDFDLAVSRPKLYVEAKSHSVFGNRPATWPLDDFPGGDGVLYIFSYAGQAEEPVPQFDPVTNYELKSIEELWGKRDWTVNADTFSEFGTFRGDTGAANAAKAPWGWDGASASHQIVPPDFFMDPAHLVKGYFGGSVSDISPSYISRSYESIVESFHPSDSEDPRYLGYNRTWSWKAPGAVRTRLHFTKILTESGADFVNLYDGAGNLVDSLSGGPYDDYWSPWVLGDTIQIRLTNSLGTTFWGFSADQCEASPDIKTPVSGIVFSDVLLKHSLLMSTKVYSNSSMDRLTINDIAWTSGSDDYVYIGPPTPFVIMIGSSRSITFRFSPTSEGAKNATFTIYSDAANNPSVPLSMTGNGINHPPDTPSNLAPADGTTVAVLAPSLQSSPFSDPDFGHSHCASQWQISTTAGSYSSPIYDSDTDIYNLTHITTPSGILNTGTNYWWHVRHQDCYGKWSLWSAETSFNVPEAPDKPSNLSPIEGVIEPTLNPTLQSSPFSCPGMGSHVASQWQITATQGDYSNISYDSGTDSANLTHVTVPSGKLNYEVIYFWRVRYQAASGAWSAWSNETSFIILPPPNTPINISPVEGIFETSLTPTLQSSAFSYLNEETHMASNWQITVVSGEYSVPVYDSGTDIVNLTETMVPSETLINGTTYYWRVRYQASNGTWSDWSSETSFVVMLSLEAAFSYEPASGRAPLTVQFTDNSTGQVTSYTWDFDGDGAADSTEQNPSYVFKESGVFTVSLTVASKSFSSSQTISIEVQGHGGFFDCGGGSEAGISTQSLAIGWGTLGLCCGTVYIVIRRKDRRRKGF
ncbi:PKD domain-containing protein [Chloroflexota bacterium]